MRLAFMDRFWVSTLNKTLDRRNLQSGVIALGRRDADLRMIVRQFGTPPMWRRAPGFATLVQIVLEQQVSLASGRAIYKRLRQRLGRVSPTAVLELGEHRLRKVGITRQKSAYLLHLATALIDGAVSLKKLTGMNDMEVRETLIRIKGIGPWTADVYLLMALGRLDVWPAGDLALAVATQNVKSLKRRPDPKELEQIAESWRPWRAVAARILWLYYLRGI